MLFEVLESLLPDELKVGDDLFPVRYICIGSCRHPLHSVHLPAISCRLSKDRHPPHRYRATRCFNNDVPRTDSIILVHHKYILLILYFIRCLLRYDQCMIEPDGHLHLACFPCFSNNPGLGNLARKAIFPVSLSNSLSMVSTKPWYACSLPLAINSPTGSFREESERDLKFRYSFSVRLKYAKTEELSDKVVKREPSSIRLPGFEPDPVDTAIERRPDLCERKVQLCQCQIGPRFV